MAEPILELVLKGDPEKTVAAACGKCRIVAHNEIMARECCAPRICECGAECLKHWTRCDACRARRLAEEERVRVDKAEKVNWRDHDGPLFCAGIGQEFFSDVDDLQDAVECYTEPGGEPAHAWACSTVRLSLDANSIVDSALEEHHEDAWEQVDRVDELQALLDVWCRGQKLESWFADYSRIVMLDGLFDRARGPGRGDGPRSV